MAEFFSRSALRMFLFEKSSHSSGATELKMTQQTCQDFQKILVYQSLSLWQLKSLSPLCTQDNKTKIY